MTYHIYGSVFMHWRMLYHRLTTLMLYQPSLSGRVNTLMSLLSVMIDVKYAAIMSHHILYNRHSKKFYHRHISIVLTPAYQNFTMREACLEYKWGISELIVEPPRCLMGQKRAA